MTEEERAVWILEKLTKLFIKPSDGDQMYSFSFGHGAYYMDTVEDLTKWLSSPEGIVAVKAAMIDREYGIFISHSRADNMWDCEFCKKGCNLDNERYGNTEAEAVLAAAEKALKSEE